MLGLRLERRVTKFIEALPRKQGELLLRKIQELKFDPYPPGSKLLKNSTLYRIRTGNYRVAYRVEGNVVHIYLIGKRNDGDVYRKLDRMGG